MAVIDEELRQLRQLGAEMRAARSDQLEAQLASLWAARARRLGVRLHPEHLVMLCGFTHERARQVFRTLLDEDEV